MMLDVLVGVPPINPTSGAVPVGKGVDGSLKLFKVDGGLVNFRKPAEHGSLVVPHIDVLILWIDYFADLFEDGFAFGADADDLLREFVGTGGIVCFGAGNEVSGGVEVRFEVKEILPKGVIENLFLLYGAFGHGLLLAGYADAGFGPPLNGSETRSASARQGRTWRE